jgi:lactoylglutathione lyase
MKGMTSLGHVAIRITDVERSLDFYINKLGLEEMFRLHRDGVLWIVYLRLTDDQFVELFPGGSGHAPDADAVGYNHMCITVDDLDEVIARLAERGVSLSRPKKMGLDGNAQAWVEDPDGHRIELMQLFPDGMHMQAIARMKASR